VTISGGRWQPLRLYAAVAATSFRRATTYRAAALAGLLTNLFFGFVRSFIFIAVYSGSGSERIGGYDLQQAITYAALTQALIAPLLVFGWYELMATIRGGDIAGDLSKPVDFYNLWLARDLGRAAVAVLFRGVPVLLAFQLVWDLAWPASPARWLAFVTSVLLAVLVSFSWRFLVNVSAFWTVDAYGVGRVAYMAVLLLSGFVLPLGYFPDRFRQIAMVLPFHAMVNAPAALFAGAPDSGSAAGTLAVQAVWVLVLAALSRAVYRRGIARLTIQGG
jgi:ABC-2 type transport system permease protein